MKILDANTRLLFTETGIAIVVARKANGSVVITSAEGGSGNGGAMLVLTRDEVSDLVRALQVVGPELVK